MMSRMFFGAAKVRLGKNAKQRKTGRTLILTLCHLMGDGTAIDRSTFSIRFRCQSSRTTFAETGNDSSSPSGPSAPSASTRLARPRRSAEKAGGWERAGVRVIRFKGFGTSEEQTAELPSHGLIS